MKRIIFLLFAISFAATIEAQKLNNHALSSTLSPEYPPEVSKMVENLAHVKSASLETGVDSLKVYFGSFLQDGEKSYWASLYHDKKNVFQMFNLQASDSSEMLSQDIDFTFNNSSMKVSGRVLYNPTTEEVFYQWMNKNGSSKIASVQKIDRFIQENKQMPYFNVKALDGTALSLDDFKGKHLVINWWATTCGPCITEMPGLNKLVEKYESRTDVKFMAIAWDDKEKLENFLSKRDFKYQQTVLYEITW